MARILGYNSVEDLFAGLSLFERLFVEPERSEGNIALSFTLNGEYCELYYKDDGIGMPEKMFTDLTGDSLGSHPGLSSDLRTESAAQGQA